MFQRPIGKFYDSIDISFPIGKTRCHVLKMSFEQHQRSFPKHSHSDNSWEIHYIAYGSGTITINADQYEISPGIFFVTGPNVEHSQFPKPLDPVVEYCIYIKFVPNAPEVKHSKNPAFLERFLTTPAFFWRDTQNIHGLMQSLFYEMEMQNTGYLTQVNSLLTQLLVYSVRNYECIRETSTFFGAATLSDQNYLIIEECFLYEYRELTLEKLAFRLGLSPRQTERRLKEHYGKTFLQKKAEAKMSMALVYLKDCDNTITDVAELLGYSSVEHFSSAFRKYYGIAPSEWRTCSISHLPFLL